ncbi:MAG: alpha/beta hydrolase [Gammaproteobacteria bacterium]|nr:alpha/beta hydrolase [Gammaproteobacteria bacterium]
MVVLFLIQRYRAGLLGILAITALHGCSALLFQPQATLYRTPQQLHLSSEEVYFNSEGLRLHGWWLPATPPARGSVVFLHGNAENISTHIASVYWLPSQGYNVFLFDYRGYGLSQGRPDLPGVHHDFEAALQYVFSRPATDHRRVFVFGQSLGGAIATVGVAHSAWKSHLCGLVVEAAFSSYRGIAREKLHDFWLTWPLYIPLSYAMSDEYRPLEAIKQISPLPVLIIHSQSDEVIPYHHGVDLFNAAREPKTLWTLHDVRHIHAFADPANQERLLHYLSQIDCDPPP